MNNWHWRARPCTQPTIVPPRNSNPCRLVECHDTNRRVWSPHTHTARRPIILLRCSAGLYSMRGFLCTSCEMFHYGADDVPHHPNNDTARPNVDSSCFQSDALDERVSDLCSACDRVDPDMSTQMHRSHAVPSPSTICGASTVAIAVTSPANAAGTLSGTQPSERRGGPTVAGKVIPGSSGVANPGLGLETVEIL